MGNKTNSCKLLYFIPAGLIMIVIFYFSAQSADDSSKLSDGFILAAFSSKSDSPEGLIERFTFIVRKSAHFIEYAALGFAAAFGFAHSLGCGKPKTVGISAAVSALYAVTDELHQLFVPGRACQLRDMVIDSLGCLTGALLYVGIISLIAALKRKKQPQ
ncbi:MAG: VanZ family protein [Huintestinicola sp.]